MMPFGATIAGDVFQRKLDQCFGHLQIIIVIANDIMIVGKQLNHQNHDIALTKLINTAKNAVSTSTMTSCNTNKQKLTSSEKHTQ